MKIIVDNILTDNTVEEYTDELDRLFPEKIRETKLLKRGGLLIQPISAEAYNNILKHKTEFNNTIFGPLPYVHIQESKDLQQWLCVNKDTDTNGNPITSLQSRRQNTIHIYYEQNYHNCRQRKNNMTMYK